MSALLKLARRRSRSAVGPYCESMEPRLLLIAYTVTGTNNNDSISLSISGNSIISVVNGVSDSGSDIINNEIEIFGLGGDDIVSIIETGANTVTINGGTGNDTINIGNGTNDLDNIDGNIAVNGDGNTDTLILFNQNDANGGNFHFSHGINIVRVGTPVMDIDVENVTVHASSSVGQNFVFDDPPNANVTTNGSATVSNIAIFNGDGATAGTYRPDAVVTGKGSVTFSTATINFTRCDHVEFQNVSPATLITPNANDTVTIADAVATEVTGSSGGVNWARMTVTLAASLVLDVATHDAGAGNDTISGSNGHPNVTSLLINAGTGTNSLTASGGNWNLSTAVGIGGVNLNVFVAGGANVTFSGAQNLNRLQIDSNGTVGFTGAGNLLTTPQLAVVNGIGNLNLGSGQTGTISSGGAMSISAGRTLNKTGTGTLNVSATQSHGTGAFYNNSAGTTTFNTDCGSPSTRPLNVAALAGIVNFGVTQHVSSVSTNVGTINLLTNGQRVLVTNFAAVGGEGGAINLNDNDMIVDYSGPSQLEAVRALITAGYAGGLWNGIGIDSAVAATTGTTGLGYADAADLFTSFPASFSGESVDNTAVLVKYTWYGDTNLSGSVDITDLGRLATNWQQSSRRWIHGDFSYDQMIDITDLGRLATNWQQGVITPLSPTLRVSNATIPIGQPVRSGSKKVWSSILTALPSSAALLA